MKDTILKIAKCKDGAAFYKKFPTEEAFMEVHGEQFYQAMAEAEKRKGKIAAQYGDEFNMLPNSFNYQITPVSQLKPAGFTNSAIKNATGKLGQNMSGLPAGFGNVPSSNLPGIGDITSTIDNIGNAVSSFKAQKNQKRSLRQQNAYTSLALDAANSVDVDSRRQMTEMMERGRDAFMPIETGEEEFPIYGVGTNAIAQFGGALSAGTEMANNYVGKAFNNNAGFQTGKAVGNLVKFIPGVGPIASAIASPVLGAIGGIADNVFGDAGIIKKEQSKLNRTNTQLFGTNVGKTINSQYRAFTQDGGEVYENGGAIQPLWGGVAENTAYNPALPNGGEITEYSGAPHNGSNVPGKSGIGILAAGNTVEVEGKENSATIGDSIKIFGDLMVTKKMAKLSSNPEVLALIDEYGQKKSKFMHNAIIDKTKSLNNKEAKLNKELEDFDPETPYDMLTGNSYKATQLGLDMKYKKLAKQAEVLANYQTEIKDTAEDFGLLASDFAKGKITKDTGKFIPSSQTAQDGDDLSIYQNSGDIKKQKFSSPAAAKAAGFVLNPKTKLYERIIKKGTTAGTKKQIADALKEYPLQHEAPTGYFGDVDDAKFKQLKDNNTWFNWEGFDPSNDDDVTYFQKRFNDKAREIGSSARIDPDGKLGVQTASARLADEQSPGIPDSGIEYAELDPVTGETIPQVDSEGNLLVDAINATLPFWRPSNKTDLNNDQLLGEMYALSHNQVEPVWAQGYKPRLRVPYDISLQDQLNDITSQTRAGQRLAGYNPAAQSIMAGSAYDASNKVLGEQFRMNQQMKDQVYSGNLATLNDAQAKNLGIFDQQANRQSIARSNTKEAAQAALNSDSAKKLQHDSENHKLGIMENMYNYRYINDRAVNMNPLAQFAWNNTQDNKVGNEAEQALYHSEMAKQNKQRALKKLGVSGKDENDTDFGQNGANVFKPLKKIPLTRQFKLTN